MNMMTPTAIRRHPTAPRGPLVSIVIVGHSITASPHWSGRLLHETGSPARASWKCSSRSAPAANAVRCRSCSTALQTERDQCITIDTTQIRLSHGSRTCADRPAGTRIPAQHDHRCFAAAARLLIIDAMEAYAPDSRTVSAASARRQTGPVVVNK